VRHIWITLAALLLLVTAGNSQVEKFSEISPANTPALTDTVIGVQGGTTDVQYTFSQVSAPVGGGRKLLTQNTTYYAESGGNDSNPCTVSSQCLTLARLWNLAASIDNGGYTVTLQLASGGTYAGLQTNVSPFGGGPVIIQGNTSDATQVVISDASGPFSFSGTLTSVVTIQWLTLSQGTGTNYGIFLGANGTVQLGGTVDVGGFGVAPFVTAQAGATLSLPSGVTVNASASASGQNAFFLASGGQIFSEAAFVLSGTQAFTVATALCRNLGFINTYFGGVSPFSGSTPTAVRYVVADNSLIQTYTDDTTYFPGTSPGTVNQAWQYQ
jgi:hypothetical protein